MTKVAMTKVADGHVVISQEWCRDPSF